MSCEAALLDTFTTGGIKGHVMVLLVVVSVKASTFSSKKWEWKLKHDISLSYLEFHLSIIGWILPLSVSPSRRSVSRHQSQPLSPDIIQLKDMVSAFSSSRPFDHLEIISTLGVGGFGRVELVRPNDTAVHISLHQGCIYSKSIIFGCEWYDWNVVT